MKLNKYLKELGYTWNDLPGNYDENAPIDKPAADIRNEEDEEGFCDREFWNLDYTFDLFIYSRLCYFKEHISPIVTPVHYMYDEYDNIVKDDGKHWEKVLDTMIEGFRLSVELEHQSSLSSLERKAKIEKARYLLADYWSDLWY